MLRGTCGLHVRNGNFELSVIRPGCRRIRQAINRRYQNKHSEQPFEVPAGCGICWPGSRHCAQDISKVRKTNSGASAHVRFNSEILCS